MQVNLKSLVGKLNGPCQKALEGAAELCVQRRNYDVEIVHWLLKLNEIPNTDFQRVLSHFQIDQARFASDLNRQIDRLRTGNTQRPSISSYIVRLLNGAWLFASIDFDTSRIRSGHVLLTLFADDEMVQFTHNISSQWRNITAENLHANLLFIVKGSAEDNEGVGPSKDSDDKRIFISYRRDDAGGWAGRLYDRLAQHFDKSNLFMDVDTIEPGLEFADVIQNSVASCNVMIAVIGRQWLEIKDDTGQRRLDNPDDFVRLEISAALERKIRVIPVLVQGSAMPAKKDLPEALKGLTLRNALRMDETRFDHDVKQLIEVLDKKSKTH